MARDSTTDEGGVYARMREGYDIAPLTPEQSKRRALRDRRFRWRNDLPVETLDRLEAEEALRLPEEIQAFIAARPDLSPRPPGMPG